MVCYTCYSCPRKTILVTESKINSNGPVVVKWLPLLSLKIKAQGLGAGWVFWVLASTYTVKKIAFARLKTWHELQHLGSCLYLSDFVSALLFDVNFCYQKYLTLKHGHNRLHHACTTLSSKYLDPLITVIPSLTSCLVAPISQITRLVSFAAENNDFVAGA